MTLPAVFMRGGTSKALMLHRRDLPDDRSDWDALFARAMGSPDPQLRQLDGMGGGVSSLSKVCVIAPSTREDADVDYTFGQVLIDQARTDYRGNCGNMSSAVGPFAVDEGLVPVSGDEAIVRIHNTNTGKLIHARFPVRGGRARYDGSLQIPGVAGHGAAIRLDFIEPGGASTGRLLPTGRVRDTLDVAGVGLIEASLVDAANACVFVRARDLGLSGPELPGEFERDAGLMQRLDLVRRTASVAMGIAPDLEEARSIVTIPYLGLVSPPVTSTTLAGDTLPADAVDLTARVIASGQPHRALPLTVSLCLAVAARLDGSIVSEAAGTTTDPNSLLRLGMPSGILTVGAIVTRDGAGAWHAQAGSFYRTARRLFEGRVCLD